MSDDKQLLHLVIGGELDEVSPHAHDFKNLDEVEFVGAYSNYDDAKRAWRSAAGAPWQGRPARRARRGVWSALDKRLFAFVVLAS